MYGVFSNPSGSDSVEGPEHFAFSHSVNWPGQSRVADSQYNALTGQIDWMTGEFSVILRDNTSGGARSVEWQVVQLEPEADVVPEPASLALLGIGMSILCLRLRRHRTS